MGELQPVGAVLRENLGLKCLADSIDHHTERPLEHRGEHAEVELTAENGRSGE
jgi:hypothetical protein